MLCLGFVALRDRNGGPDVSPEMVLTSLSLSFSILDTCVSNEPAELIVATRGSSKPSGMMIEIELEDALTLTFGFS